MTAQEVLEQALERGVFLYLENEQLKYRVRTGALSAELRHQLKAHRDQIVHHLKRLEAVEVMEEFVPPPLQQRIGDGPVPLSHAQQRLWFIDRLGEGSAQYQTQNAHRLTGPLNVSALYRALATIVTRHEALRTVFREEQGTPQQIILRNVSPNPAHVDLSGLGTEAQAREIRRIMTADAQRPFDLSRDLMCRVTLITLTSEAHILIVDLHHIATDAWSQTILLREIVTLYTAYRDGLPDPLAPLPIQYADYAVWQRTWLQHAMLARHIDFWKKEMTGAPEVHGLPLDRERPVRPTYAGGSERCQISRETLDQIRAICKRCDVTLFMFLHAAASILFARYSDETDIVMGTPVAGRVQTELEPLIGLFVNTLPLRTRLDGNPTIEELLARDKRHILDALRHQHLPFDMLVEALRPRRSTSYTPIFQILFSVQPADPRHFSLPGLTIESMSGGGSGTNKVDLVVYCVESADELTVYIGYSTDIFLASSIARIVANFRVLLERIAAAPLDRRIDDLDLLDAAERDRLLGAGTYVLGAALGAALGETGRLLPEGAIGERCVPIAAIPHGSFGSSDAPVRDVCAAPRFVPNPFADDAVLADRAGQRTAAGGDRRHDDGSGGRFLCRTGELARWLPNGELEVVGRIANRMIVGGVRIDLTRFRATLAAASWIAQFATVARRDGEGREGVAAYIVATTDAEGREGAPVYIETTDAAAAGAAAKEAAGAAGEPRLRELRASLIETLQAQAQEMPFALVIVDRIPVGPDGAIAFESLPLPADAFAPEATFEEPATAIETRMARVWRTVLPIERLGRRDNFFAAGGHSLAMVVLITRIAREFGVDVPLAAFIQSPTIQATSLLVAQAMDAEASIAPLSDAERARPLPLSFAQARIWFIARMEEGQSSYNIPGPLRFTGRLSTESLRRAFEILVSRHAILRTVYREEDHQPVQVIQPPDRFSLPIVDLRTLPPDEQAGRVRELARADAIRPFDLATEPSVRAMLLELSDQDHVLLFNVHHIAADGWSIGVLTRELNAIYRAELEGRPHGLPALPLQYCDYAVWQREQQASARFEEDLQFWRTRLQGMPKVHSLHLDGPRPPYPTYRGAQHTTRIAREAVQALETLARAHNGTLFIALHAVLAILMHRFSGARDIVIGAPVANRLRPEVEPLIGCFVNTLVLRSDLANNPRFTDFLAASATSVLEAFAHQRVPFEQLVEDQNPVRDLSHAPLFQVMFAFQNTGGGAVDTPDVTFTLATGDENAYPISKFDLTLYAKQQRGALSLVWEYATDIFAPATIASMAAGFGTLVESIIASPDAGVDALRLIPIEVEQQLLRQGDASTRVDALTMVDDASGTTTIPALFEARVAERPDALAAACGADRLSYADLNRRANQLARHLIMRGVGPGTLVGICVPRSLELIVGLLAIIKAGGAYVPLEASFPAERLRIILADAGVNVVLATQATRGVLPADLATPILLDELLRAETFGTAADDNLTHTPPLSANALAYVIYTSGSTGQPKGVAVEHRGVTRLVWQTDYVPLDPETITLQHSAMSFDLSTFEIWAPLLNGGTVALLQAENGDVVRMAEQIAQHGVNTLWLTSGLLPLWVEQHTPALGLRYLLAGGDAVPPDSVVELHRRDPDLVVINGYGPTENTTFSTCHRVPRSFRGHTGVPIGRPIRGSSAYVLDEAMRLQPIGCPGVLYVGGAGVARGYVGQPRLTSERFVPDPFSSTLGERLYNTGDLVRWLADGTLEFLGRKDQQVKIRGFRIELGEIEAHLSKVPGVTNAVVTAIDRDGTGRQLVAYLVASEATPAVADAFATRCRRLLRQSLPEYMVPASYVLLDRMPLTPNGKIDRRALPAPDVITRGEVEYAPPRTSTEQRMCELWQELLRVPRVGIDDNFFARGGHSLLAFRFNSAAREAFGIEIPLRLVFERPTIRELGTWFDIYTGAATDAADAAIGDEVLL